MGFVTYFCQYSNLKQRRFILTRSQSIPFVQVLQIVTLPVSKSRNFILCAQFISRGYKLGMLKMYFLTRKIHLSILSQIVAKTWSDLAFHARRVCKSEP